MSNKASLQDKDIDVIVIGSGVAGLSAALFAARGGSKVLVLEKSDYIGGTGAMSGGWMWLPGASRAKSAQGDSHDEVRSYLKGLAGVQYRSDLVEAFLSDTASVVTELEEAGVELDHAETAPDYEMSLPGSRTGGRAISGAPFDARRLGDMRLKIRPPMPTMSVFGFVPQLGKELSTVVRSNQSLDAFLWVAATVVKANLSRLWYKRNTRLSNGNALIAQLLAACLDNGVDFEVNSQVLSIAQTEEKVTGVQLRRNGKLVTVNARGGVVIAAGGLSHDASSTAKYFPHVRRGQGHQSLVTPENNGASLRLAAQAGGHLSEDVGQPAAWAPVTAFGPYNSRLFPHVRSIGMPGLIAVNVDGKRFTNEADSYHSFGEAMSKDSVGRPDTQAFLVGDARTMRRYGIGYAKPWPVPRFRYYAENYLVKGRTLDDLAHKCGIDGEVLINTIREYNVSAREGKDPQFHRGETVYNTLRGDAEHRPNPSIGPVGPGPYFAVPVVIGDLGTFIGIDVDDESRVLTSDGTPIPNLFAVGSAAVSPFGGAYPGYGSMLGPHVVMGARVGRKIAKM